VSDGVVEPLLDAGAAERPSRDGAAETPAPAVRRGLVAVGDSITNGRGEPWIGVPAQSWAQWVAEAYELPFTKLARDGARTRDLLAEQLPRLRGPYEIACLYAGVNDARSLDWDADAYERELRALAAALGAAAERLLICTLPEDLGRPSCAPKAARASAIVRMVAGDCGALVVPLDDLRGRRELLPDVVHPTAWGQVEIAARAVLTLRAAGLPPRHEVWTLAEPQIGARAAFAAERRRAKLLARDLGRRALERARR
jgi:hypothetical protein